MYKVAIAFLDSADGFNEYAEGSAYPRKGYVPSDDRITKLKASKHITEPKKEAPKEKE